MKVLIACEESQVVCKAFRDRGHEAYSCDILPCSGGHPEWHLQQDVLPLLKEKWDLIIAHPPCTHLSTSGARHFEKKRKDGRQEEAIKFFCEFLKISNCKRIAIENPVNIISGNYIQEYFPKLCKKYNLPRKCTQVIQPYEFGDPYKKTTCLWLKGLPLLKPTKIVKPNIITSVGKNGRVRHYSADYGFGKSSKERSKTYQGIANAIAEQWGDC